jgi:hypothetical protein
MSNIAGIGWAANDFRGIKAILAAAAVGSLVAVGAAMMPAGTGGTRLPGLALDLAGGKEAGEGAALRYAVGEGAILHAAAESDAGEGAVLHAAAEGDAGEGAVLHG